MTAKIDWPNVFGRVKEKLHNGTRANPVQCLFFIFLIQRLVPRYYPIGLLEYVECGCPGNEVKSTGILHFKQYYIHLPRFCPGAG